LFLKLKYIENMNPIKFTLIPAAILILCCCIPENQTQGDFRLIPSPCSFEIHGNSTLEYNDLKAYTLDDVEDLVLPGGILNKLQMTDDPSRAQITGRVDAALAIKAEGYTLEISRQGVEITGKDRAGLMYGFVTLGQLMEDAREQEMPLPLCTITDFPQLSYRAIHLDVKHHMEKASYYRELVDWLATYKVNAIIAEMEDKLGYERRPGVASPGAMSIAWWKDLSDYAMERNIEISPLIQGLGHASFILKHKEFAHLRDDPQSDWAFNPLDEGTYELQFDLYRDALEATPHGRFLHVGGDEVHTTGRGSGKLSLELQLTWLERVCDFADKQGRIPIFWDDMPLKHAGLERAMYNPDLNRQQVEELWAKNEHTLLEFLDRFPKNCIYMRWNYSTPQAEGNLKAMEWFREHGLQVMGATAGQTRWVLMPQKESNIDNIRSFALSSIEKGLGGLLLTLWDDDSPHFELYKRGIVAFAAYNWSGDALTKDEIKAAYRHREFSFTISGEEYGFIDLLERPVAFWNNALLEDHDRRRLRKMSHPLEEAVIALPDREEKRAWTDRYAGRLAEAGKMLALCDSVEQIIMTAKDKAVRNTYRLEVYHQVCRLSRFAPEALLALEAYDKALTGKQEREALERIARLPVEFEEIQKELEQVYSETRILDKPTSYILDQDHHNHLANQGITLDWQFITELLFLEKLDRWSF
jgi:hexosaminidase